MGGWIWKVKQSTKLQALGSMPSMEGGTFTSCDLRCLPVLPVAYSSASNLGFRYLSEAINRYHGTEASGNR